MNYREFVSDAMAKYTALPQETDSRYGRHYLRIPEPESYSDTDVEGKNAPDKKALYVNDFRFDAMICSDGQVLNGSKSVEIKETSKLDSRSLEEAALGSAKDKYAAYINAHSKNTVFVNVPDRADAKVGLRFNSTNARLNVRVVVNIGKDASLNLLELYESASRSVVGAINDVRLKENASAEINT